MKEAGDRDGAAREHLGGGGYRPCLGHIMKEEISRGIQGVATLPCVSDPLKTLHPVSLCGLCGISSRTSTVVVNVWGMEGRACSHLPWMALLAALADATSDIGLWHVLESVRDWSVDGTCIGQDCRATLL